MFTNTDNIGMNVLGFELLKVALPHLTLSQIHDALSCYYEHKGEIDSGRRQ